MRFVFALACCIFACTHDEPKISADRAREVGGSPTTSTSASVSAAPTPSPIRDPFAPPK